MYHLLRELEVVFNQDRQDKTRYSASHFELKTIFSSVIFNWMECMNFGKKAVETSRK